MAEYRLSPAAQRDLDDIFEFTMARWGLAQAVGYTDMIETACADLANAPLRSQDCTALRSGYRRRSVEHHVLYFQMTPGGIAVVRILHQRMDALRHL